MLRGKKNATTAIVAGGVAALAGVGAVLRFTPRPSAMLIRSVFEEGAKSTAATMWPDAPADVIRIREGIPGHRGAPDTIADVYRPAGVDGPLPTVVWIHGGAWISGDRGQVEPYLRMIAARGYTVVGLDYALGPESVYPTAPKQLLLALEHLRKYAGRLGIARDRLALAGDSAGAQLASQLATVVTNPSYARASGLPTKLPTDAIRAVVLHCGIYDLKTMSKSSGLGQWGFQVALWSYTGRKNWSKTLAGDHMSTIDHVTPRFPPTFISGGNADPLTEPQSRPFAAHLASLGVPVTALFYPDDHGDELPHEYQFHWYLTDAHVALEKTLAFLTSTMTR
ncbi:alpha/beta hydrolase [Microbacteriaceae bacterium VKM Ac-2854]|nr:alpha/beta hydrolase [Microbacteriaceae bacterium VKM Ac-2854]